MWQHLIVPHTYMYNKQPRSRSSHYKLPQHGWNKQNVNQGNHRDYHIHILHRSFISVVGCNWYIMIFLFHLTHTVSLLEGLGARSGYLVDCFMLLIARHLADVSCYIGPSMPSGICMEIHIEIVQKRKKKQSRDEGNPRQPHVYL